MDRHLDRDPGRLRADVLAWLFEQIHADPAEARRVLCAAMPQMLRGLDRRTFSRLALDAVVGVAAPLHGIVAHLALHEGREIAVLLVESRRRSCEGPLRRAVAAVVRSLRRSGPRRRVFVVFVAR